MNFNGTMELGEDFKISFGLNIAGTSATPNEVRVFLSCCDSIRLCSIALLNPTTHEYETCIPVLTSLFTGKKEAKLTIEVLLNGKVITPYSQVISLLQSECETIEVSTQSSTEPTVSSHVITQDELRQAAERPGRFFTQDEVRAKGIEFLNKMGMGESIKEEVVEKPKQQIQFKKPKLKEVKPVEPMQLDMSSLLEAAEEKHGTASKKKVKPLEVKHVTIVKEEKNRSSLFKLHKTKIIER